MPVLPLETYLFPDQLFAERVVAPSLNWWVLHTKPRTEKSLARQCLSKELSYFLPLLTRSKNPAGRSLRSHLPLFPGYFFLLGDNEDRIRALETNLVVHCLPVVDQSRLHQDLARVYRLMNGTVPISAEERLQPGMKVEITSGAFRGMAGTLLRRGDRFCFVVEIEILRQGVSVEVDRGMFRIL